MKLILVSGSSGAIGKAYLDHFKSDTDALCVGISRTPAESEGNLISITTDLLDAGRVHSAILDLDLSDVSNIYFIHPVGKFKFEEDGKPENDYDGDGIDDEVYKTNVETFSNVAKPLVERIKTLPAPVSLTLCAFGSVSDKYLVPFWQSYTKSKDILRTNLQNLARNKDIRALFINVSTTDTGNENKLRPYADHAHWLKPSEIVTESVPVLLEDFPGYKEIEIFRHRPGFDESYYSNPKEILEKWHKEMGK